MLMGSDLLMWEYKVIPLKTRIHSARSEGGTKPIIEDIQRELNILGKESWELVSIQDITMQDGRMFTVAYLKRKSKL
jgi:hypothetical protein